MEKREDLRVWILENYKSVANYCRETGADYPQMTKFMARGTIPYSPTRRVVEATTPYNFTSEVK